MEMEEGEAGGQGPAYTKPRDCPKGFWGIRAPLVLLSRAGTPGCHG